MARLSTTTAILVALLAFLLPALTVGQTMFNCPDAVGTTWTDATRDGTVSDALVLDSPDVDGSQLIELHGTTGTGQLCTLFTIALSTDGSKRFYVPVGRSYDGREWEKVAGKHARLSYACHGTCRVILPDVDTQQYFMAMYKHDTMTDEQKLLRFYERATFGGRLADVSNQPSAPSTEAVYATLIENWNSAPATSHREYFRERLTPRSLEIYKYGETGPHPCDRYSRWRSFAFTRKDKTMSVGPIQDNWPMIMHNATLEQRNDKWVWLYDGHVRTVLDAQPQWVDGITYAAAGTIPNGTWQVCGVDEVPGSSLTTEKEKYLYARFRLRDYDDLNDWGYPKCNGVLGGNPDVVVDVSVMGANNPLSNTAPEPEPYVVQFTDTVSTAAGYFEDIGYDPTVEGGVGHGGVKAKSASVKLLVGDVNTNMASIKALDSNANDQVCQDVPDPSKSDYRDHGWFYSPYYDGVQHPNWSPSSRSYLDQPVFAKLDDGAGNVEWRIHDRRLLAKENTLASPLTNGGGEMVLNSIYKDINARDDDDPVLTAADADENPRTDSAISGNENAIYCPNGEPNIFNEDSCVLSTAAEACVREGIDREDTITVMELGATSIAALNGHLSNTTVSNPIVLSDSRGKGFAATVIDIDFEVGVTNLPCKENSVSRWYKTSDVNESACNMVSFGLNSATVTAFQHLLKYAVTNNDLYREITMSEMGQACDEIDATGANSGNAKQFKIWAATVGPLGTCFMHVHPDVGNVYFVTEPGMWQHIEGGHSISWVTDVGGSGESWRNRNSTNWKLWGIEGELVRFENPRGILDDLGYYEAQGGKAVTAAPTSQPSGFPTATPSLSLAPSVAAPSPSAVPSASGAPSGSQVPSSVPSATAYPSGADLEPSVQPSGSSRPSRVPSISAGPSAVDSAAPSLEGEPPSAVPSVFPSVSQGPSIQPSKAAPSAVPSASGAPSQVPSKSGEPTMAPSQISQVARTMTDSLWNNIINDPAIGQVVLETRLTMKTGGVLVCGSEGEIKSDPTHDDYFDYWNLKLDSTPYTGEQKKTVWTNIALTADDQLCQRVAFALSQIFAISPSFLAYASLSEAHMAFYDGFVRNCHAPYKVVMKTIAFSVKMGMQLSHVGSQSFRTRYDSSDEPAFPDENFARESMQLQTVGLELLNMDGTVVRDQKLDQPVPTYDNYDILTYARVWTGMVFPSRRGNYEELNTISNSWNDPMLLKDGNAHDWFPKMDLMDGWLGDRYPLCSDLPEKAFLKKGATYKLLGRTSVPRYQFDKGNWENDQRKKFTLTTGSGLLLALSSVEGSYRSTVTLTNDVDCFWKECQVDTVRVVQVSPDVFYEYVRVPCVHHAFFEAGTAVAIAAGGAGVSGARMCADPSQPVATSTCCPSGGSCAISCKYSGEYVTYATNKVRCLDDNANICGAGSHNCNTAECPGQLTYSPSYPGNNHFQWTKGSCDVKVKVRLDGMIALVHDPEDGSNENDQVVKYVQNTIGNMNYFNPPWPIDDYAGDKLFPTIDNGCGEGTCVLQEDDWTCLCNVTVTNTVPFETAPTYVADIELKCVVGAFPPSRLTGYTKIADLTLPDGDVSAWQKDGGGYNANTIFELIDDTDEFFDFGTEWQISASPAVGKVFLKNIASDIQIGDAGNLYYTEPVRKPLIMKNPTMFHDLAAPEIRDGHYEIDAHIHHLTTHRSAPPFIAIQLIQHIAQIANPSPNMIARVASAYVAGQFIASGKTFGDGRHGNLDATVAAILLDPEAMSETLDADPAYGGLQEPLLKVLKFMRAMEYKQTPHDRNFHPKLVNMQHKIGQMAYESRDQFSFFLPDYMPPGQFSQALLNSPASQVQTLYTTVATMEGLFALPRDGLTGKSGGFGIDSYGVSGVLNAGDHSASVGFLAYQPDAGLNTDLKKVQEIADLLTSGRMHPDAVQEIATYIGGATSDDSHKIMIAQQLVATASEFHSTNLATRTGTKRQPSPIQEPSGDSYKAVVILFASGGMDSWNLLTPHTTCDLYASYRKERGPLRLRAKEMVRISNSDPKQNCDDFGINSAIPFLKTIYDAGHGQFHANIGHLHKPVTKKNWSYETATHLFSHKTMEREAQLVDAFQEDGWSTGVAGRMLDVLQRRGMSVNAVGIDRGGFILEGNPGLGRTVDVIPSGNVNTLQRGSLTENGMDDLGSILPTMEYLNEETVLETSGVFGNFWSQNLVDVLNKTDSLKELLNGVTLTQYYSGNVASQLAMVAKLIILREERGANRDVFLTVQGGHDSHALGKKHSNSLLSEINSGIQPFYREMEHLGLLDHVTFVLMSEFGRSITPNSGRGSDHAWGGCAFVFGGQIAPKILGQYPTYFSNLDEKNIGRGLTIPSYSWESMWYGIGNWMGLTSDADMKNMLPNNGNMGCDLYTDADMYNIGTTQINGCGEKQVKMKITMLITEARYLTGLEQKRVCRAALGITEAEAGAISRCVIVGQEVIVNFSNGDSLGGGGGSRRLTEGELDPKRGIRFLNSPTVDSVTVISTANFDYLANATSVVENATLLSDGLNAALTCTNSGSGATRRRRLTGDNGGTCISNCVNISSVELDLSQAPSSMPSTTSHPSEGPSSQPSEAPSLTPSESWQPSGHPSEGPSLSPSESLQPSGVPPSIVPSMSQAPSEGPSDKPSGVPTVIPSQLPSEDPSGEPSQFPTEGPSGEPSGVPTTNPSQLPSGRPSGEPSDKPSLSPSLEPTPPQPSAKPSVAPSGRPSRLCVDPVEYCGVGGLWSPFTCECLCLTPFCPGTDRSCNSKSCAANYHKTLFDDQPEPWFRYGSTCTATKDVPSTTTSIYFSKEDCCKAEYSKDVSGCVSRPAELQQLTYNGIFTLTGLACPNNGSARAATAGNIAQAILAALCTGAGLTCTASDSVAVTRFCGQDYKIEATYDDSSRRRLQTFNRADNTVQWTFKSTGLDYDTLRGMSAVLDSYLSGTSLTTFLAAVVTNIQSSNPTASLVAVTALVYEAVNAFIAGLGLYYPAWGYLETCISDGGQEPYMNSGHSKWLYDNLDACCQRYYGWDPTGCRLRNAEVTLVSGAIGKVIQPSDGLYFPDWGKTDTCINDGTAPPYMAKQHELWMYPTLGDCCRAYYGWEEGFAECMSSSGLAAPTQSPIDETWYVIWSDYKCVKSCEGNTAPCGGLHKPWDNPHSSKAECCAARMPWIPMADCMKT